MQFSYAGSETLTLDQRESAAIMAIFHACRDLKLEGKIEFINASSGPNRWMRAKIGNDVEVTFEWEERWPASSDGEQCNFLVEHEYIPRTVRVERQPTGKRWEELAVYECSWASSCSFDIEFKRLLE
jgi:hypothetical protein